MNRWHSRSDVVCMLSALTNPTIGFARSAYRSATREVEQSLVRLATGQKLNKASDDPSGLTGAEQMRATEKRLSLRVDSIELEEAMLGAREGASSVIADSLIDLQGLLTRHGNSGALTDQERQSIQDEVSSVLETIDFLAATSSFNGQQLIEGRSSARLGMRVLFGSGGQEPASSSPPNDVPLRDPSDLLGLAAGGHPATREDGNQRVSLASLGGNGLRDLAPADAQAILDASISEIAGDRAAIGSRMQDLAAQRREALVELENTAAARAAITDADIGQETASLIRAQMMQQASLYTQQMAAQRQSEVVLDLLKSATAPPPVGTRTI